MQECRKRHALTDPLRNYSKEGRNAGKRPNPIDTLRKRRRRKDLLFFGFLLPSCLP
jgi:hypothetical protein